MRSATAIQRAILASLAVLVGLAAPAAVLAHPLGNFTINHYAALRVGPDAVSLDVVVDFAEIPAFQERITIDTNADGDVSDAEADAARAAECDRLVPDLHLAVRGTALALTLRDAGLEFPAGAGGVPTMRVVCEFDARALQPLTDGRTMTFQDTSHTDQIGWREIVVLGDGVSIHGVAGAPPPAAMDVSTRLSAYPQELLTRPLAIRSAAFTVSAGGPALPPFVAPDAAPLAGSSGATQDPGAGLATPRSTAAAAVPGGVAADVPDLFRVADLTPILALASIALAIALGAGHALTPGHGKTLMAAYLVGTRGSVRHAIGLGLVVTISHTVGILGLALLVTAGESLLPPDVVVRTIPVVAALAFVAIGGWMLLGEIQRRRVAAKPAEWTELEHHHGPTTHKHVAAVDRTLRWRSLVALGLAGGIIPSTSALIILLGTIVAGRAAFGVVLVVAFGIGMALVLGGAGTLMVVARDRLDRLPGVPAFGRLAGQAPLIASVVVLGIGLWLTAQALAGAPVL